MLDTIQFQKNMRRGEGNKHCEWEARRGEKDGEDSERARSVAAGLMVGGLV